MQKNDKKVRNKARDAITDYYRTGREYDKDNRKRQQEDESSGKWRTSEKAMLVIIILAAIGCFIRYFVLKV